MITVLYVHGAGPQKEPEPLMRTNVRDSLGLLPGVPLEVVYYADILHPITGPTWFGDVVAANEDQDVAPDVAARAIVEAVRPGGTEGLDPITYYSVVGTIRSFYESADMIAAEREGIADWRGSPTQRLLRGTAGLGGVDVAVYFTRPERHEMRRRVKERIRTTAGELVVVAHSLGSIIAVDALAELGTTVRLRRFVTIGSPLGIPWVKWFLECCRPFQRCATPDSLADSPLDPIWVNAWDRDDPVSGLLEHEFASEYRPSDRNIDDEVLTPDDDPHGHHGYLRTKTVRDAVRTGL